MFFPKRSRRKMICLVYQEKWLFFFPKIWSYPLDGKWKVIFLKKIYGNMISSSDVLERWSFQKNCTGIWSFLYYLERWFFSWKHIFSLDGRLKMIGLKEYMETWYFLCICVGVREVVLRPSAKNNQRHSSPVKMHLKVIETLDWHSRKTSNNSQYLYGGLYRRFGKLLSSEKNQET